MSLVKTFTSTLFHTISLTPLSGYIYAGYTGSPGYVQKISPSTMSLVKTFTAPTGHFDPFSLATLSGYVFAGYYSTPGYVDKINPSTMTLVKTFTAPSGHKDVTCLTTLAT